MHSFCKPPTASTLLNHIRLHADNEQALSRVVTASVHDHTQSQTLKHLGRARPSPFLPSFLPSLRKAAKVRRALCVRPSVSSAVTCYTTQSSVVDRSGNIAHRMKVLVAVLALAAAASARPGGYTANGGVYNFDPNVHLDYMDHARNAGKVLLINP